MVRGGGTGSSLSLIFKLCDAVVAVGKLRHTGGTRGFNGGREVKILFAVFSSDFSRCVSQGVVVTVIGTCTAICTVDTVYEVEMCVWAGAWDKDEGH